MENCRKKYAFKIIGMLTFQIIFLLSSISGILACDVAVVSGRVTTNGKPLIWKNRDCSANWHQELKYFPAKKTEPGGYIMVYNYDEVADMNNGTPVNPSGGINEAGFANACTSVYEDFNPLHEAININTDLVRESLKNCVTVEDFENLLKDWKTYNVGKVISGNFVVIDAFGGAALFECYTGFSLLLKRPMKFKKYDANTGEVKEWIEGKYIIRDEGEGDSFIGFHNRANNNSYISINFGEERKERATELLTNLVNEDRLDYRSVLREVSKDVVGTQEHHPDSSEESYSTTYCISRNQTRLGMVVDGVEAGGNPELSTFWCVLGEPSIAVYAPYFANAKGISDLAWVDGIGIDGTKYNFNDTCLLSRASNRREIYDYLIYKSNTGSGLSGMDNRLMNKIELAKVQKWTFQIEDFVLDKTEEYINVLKYSNVVIESENLREFSDKCVDYVYENFNAASPDYYPWTH